MEAVMRRLAALSSNSQCLDRSRWRSISAFSCKGFGLHPLKAGWLFGSSAAASAAGLPVVAAALAAAAMWPKQLLELLLIFSPAWSPISTELGLWVKQFSLALGSCRRAVNVMLSLLSAVVYSVVSASHLVCTFYSVHHTSKHCVDEIGRHRMVFLCFSVKFPVKMKQSVRAHLCCCAIFMARFVRSILTWHWTFFVSLCWFWCFV